MSEERGEHFVRAVERAMAVLRAFSADRPELTLTEVAHATGLDRAGARRLLLTLVDLGYLDHDGRLFTLGRISRSQQLRGRQAYPAGATTPAPHVGNGRIAANREQAILDLLTHIDIRGPLTTLA